MAPIRVGVLGGRGGMTGGCRFGEVLRYGVCFIVFFDIFASIAKQCG